jgi:hypothetical protein
VRIGQWQQYGRPAPGQSAQNQITPIATVNSGQAYRLYYEGVLATNWPVNGLLLGNFALNFAQGWNLVSVPATGDSTNVSIISIFSPGDIGKIQSIARWEASAQRLQLYDPVHPETSDFQTFNPNLSTRSDRPKQR